MARHAASYGKTAWGIFFFNLLAYSSLLCFAFPHASIDSYFYLDKGLDCHCQQWISCHRYFGALVSKIWFLLGHNPILDSRIDTVCFIVSVSFSSMLLTLFIIESFKCRSSEKKDWSSYLSYAIIDFSIIVSVYNVWLINILTFPECIIGTAFGVVLCHLAIIAYYGDSKYRLIISSVLLICSMACFQQFLTVFIIFAVTINNLKSLDSAEDNDCKKAILWYPHFCLFVLISCIIYFGLGRLIQQIMNVPQNSRVVLELRIMLKKLVFFSQHQHSYLKGRGFFTSDILTFCFLTSFAVFTAMTMLYYIKTKRLRETLLLLLSTATAYGCSFFMGLVSTSRTFRTMFGLFSVFALFSIVSMRISQLFHVKYVQNMIIMILAIVFSLNGFKSMEMALEQIRGNTIEKMMATLYWAQIEQYEKATEKKIDRILICWDPKGDCRHAKALYVTSAIRSLMHLVSRRDFIVRKMNTKDRLRHFDNKNWNTFIPEEQLVFEDNTLYLCIF